MWGAMDNDVFHLTFAHVSGILMGSKDILHSEQTVIELLEERCWNLGWRGVRKEGSEEHLSCYHQGM